MPQISNLGLNFKPYAIREALMRGDETYTLACGTVLKLVHRNPDSEPKFKSHHHLYDLDGEHMHKGGKAVNEANGFLVIPADESVLFYSGGMW